MSAVEKVPLVDVSIVPVSRIHENPWNPNVQDDRTYKAERESIAKYGFVVPMIVRPHPTLLGELVPTNGDGWSETEYQAVDGAHRRRGAIDEGYDDVSINNLGRISDDDAKKLTVILNETKGDADISLLGKLLSDIHRSGDGHLASLQNSLPYTDHELNHLLAIGSHDWDTFHAESDRTSSGAAPSNAQYTVFLAFDQAQREKFDAFTTMLVREAQEEGYTAEQSVIAALEAACKQL